MLVDKSAFKGINWNDNYYDIETKISMKLFEECWTVEFAFISANKMIEDKPKYYGKSAVANVSKIMKELDQMMNKLTDDNIKEILK